MAASSTAARRRAVPPSPAQPPLPPFPLAKVLTIGAVQLANTVSYLSTAPFVAFMVMGFYGGALSEEAAGYRTGLLEGMYHAGAVPGALFWGWVADRYGRKPATMLGLAGTVVSALAFGLSRDFVSACVARFAWGALNQNIGVVKSMMSEICADAHTARAFSYIGLSNGIGRVLAPVLGGFLAEPARKFPAVFGGSWLLRTYPYLLPCLVCALGSALILAASGWLLEETLDLARAEMRAIASSAAKAAVANGKSGGDTGAVVVGDAGGADADDADDGGDAETERLAIRRTESRGSRRSRSESAASAADSEVMLTPHVAAAAAATAAAASTSTITPPPPPPAAEAAESVAPVARGCAGDTRRLLGDRAILVSIGCYCLLGMGALVTNELQPLYLLLPTASGGFGWRSSEIGLVSAMAGPPLIVFQLFFYDRLVARWGLLPVARWSFAVTTLCVLMQPWCSLALQLPAWLHLPVVGAHFCVLAVSRISSFTSVFVFVANAALPVDRGRVNGLSQSLVSAARAVGPPLFTPLFAWAVESKLRYPLDLNLPFLLLAALTASTLWLTYALPPWIVRKRATM